MRRKIKLQFAFLFLSNCVTVFSQKNIAMIDTKNLTKSEYVVIESKEYCETIIPTNNWTRIGDFVNEFTREIKSARPLISIKLNTNYGLYIPTIYGGGKQSRTCVLIERIELKNELNKNYPEFIKPVPEEFKEKHRENFKWQ